MIEDDCDVRGLTVEVLEGLGYTVIAASDADAARDALTSGVSVDLVLTDVVLPGGTNGPQFVEEARLKRPDLKVIFMSGYPADAALQTGVLGRGKRLIDKPFRRRELARSLREMLEFG